MMASTFVPEATAEATAGTMHAAFNPIFLLLGCLLLGFIVFALIKWPRSRPWIGGGIAVWLVGVMLFYMGASPEPSSPFDAPPSIDSAWSSEVDHAFEADVYPTSTAAAVALVHRVAEDLRPLGDSLVVVTDRDFPRQILDAFVKQLGRELQLREIQMTVRRDEALSRRNAILLEHHPQDADGGPAALSIGDHQVRYLHKPWVEKLPDSDANIPRKLRGRSAAFRNTEREAFDQAMRDAARQLVSAVVDRLERPVRDRHVPESAIYAMLQAGDGMVVDRFSQRLSRPYGDVWRAAVLVDASPNQIDRIARTIDAREQQHRASGVRTIGSIVGLIIVVFAIYFLLNFLTRGYYRERLQATMLILAGVGFVLVWWLIA